MLMKSEDSADDQWLAFLNTVRTERYEDVVALSTSLGRKDLTALLGSLRGGERAPTAP